MLAPLRADLRRTRAEPHEPGSLAPPTPAAPTISRRGLLALVASASAGLLVVTVGQSAGGPLRRFALLAPRGQSVFDDGPNGFPVNKTAATARITPALTGPDWRLAVDRRSERRELAGAQLLAMEQHEHDCRSRASRAGRRRSAGAVCACATSPRSPARRPARVLRVESLQPRGVLRRATLGHAPALRRARAARAARQRRRPVARPRLPGADHRARAARRALHEMGREPDLGGVVIARARRRYGASPLHLARPSARARAHGLRRQPRARSALLARTQRPRLARRRGDRARPRARAGLLGARAVARQSRARVPRARCRRSTTCASRRRSRAPCCWSTSR